MLVLEQSFSVPSSSSSSPSSSCSASAFKPCSFFFCFHGSSRASLHRFNPTLPKSNRCRITCAAGDSKEDAARKALEQAFEGKKSLAKKWEEEIRKREGSEGGGGGSDGGRGGGGDGGGGGYGDMGGGEGDEEPFDWREFGEVSMATTSLILFYLLIAHGPKNMLAFFRNIIRFVSRGFRVRKMPDDYEIPVRPRPPRPKQPQPQAKKRLRNMSLV